MTPRLEDCKPGLRPFRYNVLVAIDVIAQKTAGGIHLPEKMKERTDAAAEKGLLVDVSPMSFQGGDWDLEGEKPKPGDMILFKPYSGGNEFEGPDGNKYRLVSDDDIKGIYL